MNSNLGHFYYDELWFQIGELIQELIILAKNCFFIENNGKKTIWTLFGRDLFEFFKKFTDLEKEILPKTSSAIFTIGATRFQKSYNEDKLLLIEEELYKNVNPLGNNLAIILFLQELKHIYSTLYDENSTQIFILNRILLKKIIFSNRIKKLLTIFSQIFFTCGRINGLREKIKLRNTLKESNFNRAYIKKVFSPYRKIFPFLNKMKYLFSSKINKWQKINLRAIVISHNCQPKVLQLDKEDWFFNYSYKTLKYKTINQKFLQNQALPKNISGKKNYDLSCFYQHFFSKICVLSNKINFRLSKLSKKLNGNKIFIEKLLQYNLYKIPTRFLLSQERQIISINRASYFIKPSKYEVFENFSFDIQKTLNKLWDIKKKTKHNNS